MKRLPIVLSATAALLGSSPVGHAVVSEVPPFVEKAGYADLAGSAAALDEPAPSEEYVPFVTDFPKPAGAPVRAADPAAASAGGIDWVDVGIGSGIGAALAALLAGSGLVLTRRVGPARS